MSRRTSSAPPARPRGTEALPAWARKRLGIRSPGDPAPEDPSQDRALIARALAYLFLIGATLSVVWLVLPHNPGASDTGVLAATIGAYALGAVLLIGLDRLPMVVLKGAITGATVVITIAILSTHENGSTYVLYYFWATVYAFSFFSWRQAALQTLLVGIAFGLVLVLQRGIWTEEIARWLLTMNTMLAAGLLVRFLAGTLRHRSLHDPLTGLPNRRLYLQRLDEALRRATVDDRAGRVAVVFLDLDGFKYVNDSLGHHAGDILLAEVAVRLGDAVRDGDLTARFGGDEFALLCRDIDGDDDALAVGRRVNDVLADPIAVGDSEFHVSASVGVAIAPRGAENGETLLRDADAAMYAAKQRGRARCELFDERLRERITDRVRIENDLRPALERGEFEVHYQPIVTLGDGDTVAVEALLRWRHPTRGIVPPADFVAVAEETGLIVPIGAFVLDRACAQLAAWDAHGGALAGITMSVNLSARQLPHAHLVAAVDAALATHGLDARRLTLELTEGMLMEEGVAPAAAIAALRDLGVRVALDDFGTGFSSLSYLQRFPLDELKLDHAFVAGLGSGGREDAIVGAVLAMASALGIRVVAEGIEHEAQLHALRGLGCPLGQGYYFARPATAAELLAAAEGRVRPCPSVERGVGRPLDGERLQRRDRAEVAQLGRLVAQRRALARGHLRRRGVRGGDRALQVAEAPEQVGGALRADALRSRQAVRRVAAQGDEVRDLRGLDAVPLAHAVCVDQLGPAARREEHARGRVRALEHVAVAGEDQGRPAGRRLGLRERAQDVVGLQVAAVERRPAERREQRRRRVPLGDQVVGHRFARGVVPGEQRDAVRRRLRAPAQDGRPRRVLVDRREHEVRRPEQRVDRPPVGAADRRRQAEVRAVHEGRGVDGEQGGGHGRDRIARCPVQGAVTRRIPSVQLMPDDDKTTKVPRSRVARTAKFGGLVGGQGARWMATNAANRLRSDEKAEAATQARALDLADELVKQLGQMKGAAMKIGQVLSTVDFDLIPEADREEFKQRLAALRDDAPRVAFKDMRKVLEKDLGGNVDEFFTEFDETPIAAASIGQVYRATTHAGADVAVKVQYPGVAEAVETDMRNVQMLIPLLKRLAPGMDAKALLGELRERIAEELDYEIEAANQRQVHRAYRGHPFVRIPEVHTALSARRVLVTEYIEGEAFDHVKQLPDEDRDRFAEIAFRFFYGLLERERIAAGDPHPGNYLLCPDGRVCFLDFGLIRRVDPEYLAGEQALARAVIAGDGDEVHRWMAELGYLPDPDDFHPDRILEQLQTAGEWYFTVGYRRLDPEYVRNLIEVGSSPRSEYFDYMRKQTLPPQALLIRRMEGLLFAVLGELRAGGDWGSLALEYIAGEPPSTPLGELDAEYFASRA